jgi:hypothetical protein
MPPPPPLSLHFAYFSHTDKKAGKGKKGRGKEASQDEL